MPVFERNGCRGKHADEASMSKVPAKEPEDSEEFLDMEWIISFSGRTPGKAVLGDIVAGSSSIPKPYKVEENVTMSADAGSESGLKETERERETKLSRDIAQDTIEVIRESTFLSRGSIRRTGEVT